MFFEDQFNFHGYLLKVKSNTSQPLDHIRYLYRRFHVDRTQENAVISRNRNGAPLIQIQDRLHESNSMTVSYGQWSNQLSITDDGCRVTCHDAIKGCPKVLHYPGLTSFYQGMMISAVGNQIRESHIIIHAGTVSWKGQGIVFPAQPNSGKSTLSVYLSQQGFNFLSDEIACFNLLSKRLEAHPRAVRLRDSSNDLLGFETKGLAIFEDKATGKWIADVEDLVGSCIGDPCPLRYVFFLNGFAERPVLKPLAKFMGLKQLLACCFNPMESGASTFAWIAPMLQEARCYELTVGPLDETAEAILNICEKGTDNGT